MALKEVFTKTSDWLGRRKVTVFKKTGPFKHGLALWSGPREDMDVRMASLRRRCRKLGAAADFDEHIQLLVEGEQVGIVPQLSQLQ